MGGGIARFPTADDAVAPIYTDMLLVVEHRDGNVDSTGRLTDSGAGTRPTSHYRYRACGPHSHQPVWGDVGRLIETHGSSSKEKT